MTVPAGNGTPSLCRDCFAWARTATAIERCPRCGSRRLVAHPELDRLSIAHIDCDAFYASVEKRDDPSLLDRPVIVGGGKRGVVSAACYVARVYGVRSAMPMFKALDACPHAVVITERLHGGPPAETLARLTRRIEDSIGVTASIGLSYNKFLAKVASDLDKPRGFFVIGETEVERFLAERPVSIIWGVGKALHRTLLADGIRTVGDLQRLEERDLMRRYGSIGQRLARFSHGRDSRRVEPGSVIKSVSSETTFDADIASTDTLRPYLWRLSEEVSGRLKRKAIAGQVVTLKLKTGDFRLHTRQRRLSSPTQLADRIYRTADDLLAGEADGRRFRLIGVGVSDLSGEVFADPPDLAEPALDRRRRVEAAMDAVRAKLGNEAIVKGRGLRAGTLKQTPSERGRPDDDQP